MDLFGVAVKININVQLCYKFYLARYDVVKDLARVSLWSRNNRHTGSSKLVRFPKAQTILSPIVIPPVTEACMLRSRLYY